MFKPNDIIYTQEDIYFNSIHLAFKAFNPYTVYETSELSEDGETENVLVGDNGLLHKLENVQHLFLYAH